MTESDEELKKKMKTTKWVIAKSPFVASAVFW